MFSKENHSYMEDIFACFALVGIVARGETTNQYEMARDAYKIAEAMLEERKNQL